MPYIVYNGKRVQVNQKYVTNNTPEETIIDVLNFNGSSYVTYPSYMDITAYSDYTVSWYMYLDIDDFPTSYPTILAQSAGGSGYGYNRLIWFVNGTHLIIDNGATYPLNNLGVSIAGKANQVIKVEMDLTIGMSSYNVVDIRFNGVSQSFVNTGIGFGTVTNLTIGAANVGGYQAYSMMHHMTIWDIDIPGIAHFTGYPAGNTDAAWKDTLDLSHGPVGTVVGGPGTRNITI